MGAATSVWKGPGGRLPARQSQDLGGHESRPRHCDGHRPPTCLPRTDADGLRVCGRSCPRPAFLGRWVELGPASCCPSAFEPGNPEPGPALPAHLSCNARGAPQDGSQHPQATCSGLRALRGVGTPWQAAACSEHVPGGAGPLLTSVPTSLLGSHRRQATYLGPLSRDLLLGIPVQEPLLAGDRCARCWGQGRWHGVWEPWRDGEPSGLPGPLSSGPDRAPKGLPGLPAV